ncbi:MAG TPA: hypothetical protein VF120_12090 [Ktedonobacterales bacterium]
MQHVPQGPKNPRNRNQPKDGDQARRQPHQPRPPVNSADRAYEAQHRALAHWLIEAHAETNPAQLWSLLTSTSYAHLWYGMRASAEMLRAEALRWLSLHQRQPGGPHPDPRLDADHVPFSARAILSTAATQILGIAIWPVPDALATEADIAHEATMPASPRPLCWIIASPGGRAPAIAVRMTNANPSDQQQQQQQQEARALFDIAQLIGYACQEHDRLADANAPGGPILLPPDTAERALLHQYARALLGLPQDCPPEWACACNAIRARFNAVPPSHDQPTEALSLTALRPSIVRHTPRPDVPPFDSEDDDDDDSDPDDDSDACGGGRT